MVFLERRRMDCGRLHVCRILYLYRFFSDFLSQSCLKISPVRVGRILFEIKMKK